MRVWPSVTRSLHKALAVLEQKSLTLNRCYPHSITFGYYYIVNIYYYTLYSLSVFSLAKSQQLILEISATYRLVSYLLADYRIIFRLRAWKAWFPRAMSTVFHAMLCLSFIFSSKQCINKTIIRFSFCDIQNNQGLGKCYQPRLQLSW